MGIVRTLLALSVVFAHTYKPIFVDGKLAVQLFYLISGFLISYIIVHAKSYSSKFLFYKNRFLRLFPIYLIVSIFSLILFLMSHFFLNGWETTDIFLESSFGTKIFLILTNIFIIGQDIVFFTSLDFESAIFQDLNEEFILQRGLLIPPSWTIALELYFYILAPFILTNKRLLLIIFTLCTSLKIFLLADGIGFERPFDYQFFPAELSIFLLGAISNQFFRPFVKNSFQEISKRKIFILFTIICLSIILNQLYDAHEITDYFIIFLMAFALPFLFEFQKNYNFDKKIGDLSYPIYLIHWIVIIIVSFLMPKMGISNEELRLLMVVLVTIVLSMIANSIIGQRIEKIRALNKTN